MILSTFTLLAVILTALCAGVAVGVWAEGRFRRRAEGPGPTLAPPVGVVDAALLDQHLKEWEVVIETQRHFHDLIIRFRQGTLTIFVASAGAAITLARFARLDELALLRLLMLPVVFWLAAGALDLFYYQRLLAGADAAAEKFDRSAWATERGFFGLTATLNRYVPARAGRWLVTAYYALPLVWGLVALFARGPAPR